MPTITLTLPVAGTTVTAGLHATNYTAIQSLVNGGLDTANWASGLIFAPSKIMQEGAARRDGLVWNGTNWVPAGIAGVYARLGATVDVNTTAAETALFSATINANDMGSTKRLMFMGSGDFLHNNVAGDTITIRVKFGAATITCPASSLDGTIGATRRPWFFSTGLCFVANQQATNVQDLAVQWIGNGTSGGVFAVSGAAFDVAAIDTTSNQTFQVTAQWSASSVNNSWRIREFAVLVV